MAAAAPVARTRGRPSSRRATAAHPAARTGGHGSRSSRSRSRSRPGPSRSPPSASTATATSLTTCPDAVRIGHGELPDAPPSVAAAREVDDDVDGRGQLAVGGLAVQPGGER